MHQPALIAEVQPSIEFSVNGAPLPQGSKVAYVINGRAIMSDMSDRKTKTRPKNALKSWRARIAHEAECAMGSSAPWLGPVLLECEFVMPRSDTHYTTIGRQLKKSAPTVPPLDLDKLLRAVGDALSKVVYHDDVQIVGFGASTKRFASSLAAIGSVHVKVTKL